MPSSKLASLMKVSKRRVNHIWRKFQDTGKEPVIGRNLGRPTKPLSVDEEEIVKKAYKRHRLGARMLDPMVRKKYHKVISHNRTHKYLLKL